MSWKVSASGPWGGVEKGGQTWGNNLGEGREADDATVDVKRKEGWRRSRRRGGTVVREIQAEVPAV